MKFYIVPEKKPNINVSVNREKHELIKLFLEKDGEGKDVGKFYENAAFEKYEKLLKQKPKTK